MDRTSSGCVEFYTPEYVVEAARRVMRGINLDPASCPAAQAVVKAERYFTEAENGLVKPWSGKVFLNPPEGRMTGDIGTRSSQAAWFAALSAWYLARKVTCAVFVGFSIDILSTAQGPCRMHGLPGPLLFPLCVPSKRIAFDEPDGQGGRKSTDSPNNGNAIVYMPNLASGESMDSQWTRFAETFADIGDVSAWDPGPLEQFMYERSGQ